MTKLLSWCNYLFTVFLQNSSNPCPKPFFTKTYVFEAETNVFHKFLALDNLWPNYNIDVIIFLRFFLQPCSNHWQKTIFHKNVSFQPETYVFHKLVVLGNFWPNYNHDLIIFLWFLLENCSNNCQKPFFTKTCVFSLKPTFSTNLQY